MVVKLIPERLKAASEFESRAVLDGSQTCGRHQGIPGGFESRAVLDGSQTPRIKAGYSRAV